MNNIDEQQKVTVLVDSKNMASNIVYEKKFTPFFIATGLVVAYAIWTTIMLKLNANYLATYSESLNLFRLLSWAFSGRIGLYFVIAWLLSILIIAAYSLSVSSDLTVVKVLSIIMIIVGFLSLAFPILFISLLL